MPPASAAAPTVNASMGGQQIGNSAEMAVATLAVHRHRRRQGRLDGQRCSPVTPAAREEWRHQVDLAATELTGVDKQILAAEIRHRIAEQDLAPPRQAARARHRRRTSSCRTKFTNTELYDWMVGQLSTVYFQSYQLAYDLAKRAERVLPRTSSG